MNRKSLDLRRRYSLFDNRISFFLQNRCLRTSAALGVGSTTKQHDGPTEEKSPSWLPRWHQYRRSTSARSRLKRYGRGPIRRVFAELPQDGELSSSFGKQQNC